MIQWTGEETDAGAPPELFHARLPEHLAGITFELQAALATVDVPLTELLAVEVGDVIPLGVTTSSPVLVRIEDGDYAHAAWGRHEGQLAIRVIELLRSDDSPESPNEEGK